MQSLLIETSTERGVIAYGNQTTLIDSKELPFGNSQSKFLMPYLIEVLKSCDSSRPNLDFIGVGVGPGSYTGIRLGVAVAQALAYVWNLPLVGICSLEGFVSSVSVTSYAAILDARIGGVYIQKRGILFGRDRQNTSPQVVPIEELGKYLGEIEYLVTPYASSLQNKLQRHYPERHWTWEERAPSIKDLFRMGEEKFKRGEGVIPPQQINLLYLRETEAERERMKRSQ